MKRARDFGGIVLLHASDKVYLEQSVWNEVIVIYQH